uniref:phospholipid-hydroperoxide glutathione peroxidase n=1 Tax=Felis catus TaxID=9685 RepID=A0ABI7ZEV5_FELCA
MWSLQEFSDEVIGGHMVHLGKYQGFLCIVTSVASRCSKTDINYTQLVDLHAPYACSTRFTDPGLPLQPVWRQQPGSNAEIRQLSADHNVTLDMFCKICVNGTMLTCCGSG